MSQLVYGHDDLVTAWVASHLNHDFGPSSSIGVIVGEQLIAGVVYSNYIEGPYGPVSIEMSIATTSPKWASRETLHRLFAYPFIQLGVKRVQASTARKNKEARRFLERLGFTFEGIARQAWPHGGDMAVYSMLKPECKWIKSYGQKFAETSRSA